MNILSQYENSNDFGMLNAKNALNANAGMTPSKRR